MSFMTANPQYLKLKDADAVADAGTALGGVSPQLFHHYNEGLQEAVNGVFSDDSDLANRLRLNVAQFAGAKAAHATKQINQAVLDGSDPLKVAAKFNRYQATEENTARARARTAKQFEQFQQTDDIFPNLRWIPSRSATPREEHRVFWNRVWAKNDPFWSANQPGNLYNCKCDWEETDDPVTDGNPGPKAATVAQGLEGNPAETGEVFTDEHPYFARRTIQSKSGESYHVTVFEDQNIAEGVGAQSFNIGDVLVSPLTDLKDFKNNLKIARILTQANHSVRLREDYKDYAWHIGKKNPEIEVDGRIGDVKCPRKTDGITSAFVKAIKQMEGFANAGTIVIDLDSGWDPKASRKNIIENTARKIFGRKEDFEEGRIRNCHVIIDGVLRNVPPHAVMKGVQDIMTALNGSSQS